MYCKSKVGSKIRFMYSNTLRSRFTKASPFPGPTHAQLGGREPDSDGRRFDPLRIKKSINGTEQHFAFGFDQFYMSEMQ